MGMPLLPAVLLRLCAQLDLLGCIGPGPYGPLPSAKVFFWGGPGSFLGPQIRPLCREPPSLPHSKAASQVTLFLISLARFPLWHMCFPG